MAPVTNVGRSRHSLGFELGAEDAETEGPERPLFTAPDVHQGREQAKDYAQHFPAPLVLRAAAKRQDVARVAHDGHAIGKQVRPGRDVC